MGSKVDNTFDIELIDEKPHKIFKAHISSDQHVRLLCKFLHEQKDRNLEIIINGKKFKFNSIIGRKCFSSGFEQAFSIVEPYMYNLIKDLENRLNVALSERDEFKNEACENYNKYIDVKREYSASRTVTKLRFEMWKDTIAQWKDNCKYLSDQNTILRNNLEGKTKKNK